MSLPKKRQKNFNARFIVYKLIFCIIVEAIVFVHRNVGYKSINNYLSAYRWRYLWTKRHLGAGYGKPGKIVA